MWGPTATSSVALSNEPFTVTLTDASGQQEQAQATASWTASSTTGGGGGTSSGTPTLTLSASTTTPSQSATSTLTATGSGLASGDTMAIVQETPTSTNTFSSGGSLIGSYYQTSGVSNPLSTSVYDSVSQGGFSASYYAEAFNTSGQVVATSSYVTIVWGQAPSITMTTSALPSELPVLKTSALTVTITGDTDLQDYVYVFLNGETLFGGGPSQQYNNTPISFNQSDLIGLKQVFPGTTNTFQFPVSESTPGNYQFQVWLWNYQTQTSALYSLASGSYNPLTITFTDAQTVLSANTIHAIVGQPVTLTATQPGNGILDQVNQTVVGSNNSYYGTTSYSNQGIEIAQTANTFSPSDPSIQGMGYGFQYGSSYMVFNLTPPPLPELFSGNAVSGVYDQLITQSAPSTSQTVVSYSPGTATFQAHYFIVSSNFSYQGPNVAPYYGPEGVGSYVPGDLQLNEQPGLSSTYSVPITITWSAVSVSLSASSTNLYAGQSSTLTATATGLGSGYTVVITDGGNGSTLSGANTASSSNATLSSAATMNTAGSDAYTAAIVNSSGQTVATSAPVTVKWTQGINLTASPTSLYTGQAATLTVSFEGNASGNAIEFTDGNGWKTLSGSSQVITTSPLPNVGLANITAVSQQAGADNFTASIVNSSGQVLVSSSPVTVTWVQAPTITLSASQTVAPVGAPVTLTASGINYPPNYVVKMVDLSGAQTFNGINFANGFTDPYSTQAASGITQSVLYQAEIIDDSGNVAAKSNTVQVTWQHSFLTNGEIFGLKNDPGYPGSSGAPVNMWLSPAMNDQTAIYASNDYYLPWFQQHGWDGLENDQHISLGQAMGGGVNYQPDVNRAPQASQATGTFINLDGKSHYLYGYGQSGQNPWGSLPWAWVRPEGQFGFLFTWQGSATNLPVGGTVTWTMANPDGASRTWSTPFQYLTSGLATAEPLDGWMPNPSLTEQIRYKLAAIDRASLVINGNSASERILGQTSVPNYVFQGGGTTSNGTNIELAAWSLASDAATVKANSAQISVNIQLQLQNGQTVTYNQPDMVSLFNLPAPDIIEVGGDTFVARVKKELQNNGGVVGIFPNTFKGIYSAPLNGTTTTASTGGTLTTKEGTTVLSGS